jgi:polyphosphate kinase
MRPQCLFRFEIPDRATLERLVADPLPWPDAAEETTDLEFFRDIYFDTRAADLEQKGATARLRLHKDGTARLLVDVLEPRSREGTLRRRSAEAEVDAEHADPAAFLAGSTEPVRLLRGLIDPAQLDRVLELETLRRLRTASVATGAIQCSIDLVTVRADALAGELLELELVADEVSADRAARLAGLIEQEYGLRPVLAGTARRARDLFRQLELSRLELELRAAREVALIVHDAGAIALIERDGNLSVPHGPGAGADACRRVLRRTFGHGRARIRLLGVRADVPGWPAIEVWLAEDVAPPEDESTLTWVALEKALDQAGAPGMRDARTLAALQVVARSSFASWVAPVAMPGLAARRQRSVEPFELVLQKLEAGDTSYEPAASEVGPELLLNMELARLAFDERILVHAEDAATPLLESVRFLSMFGERRDDFFTSRVAHFKRLLAASPGERTLDGLTPAEQLDAIAARARQITRRAYRLLNRRLLPDLAAHGIGILRWSSLAEPERAFVRETYGPQLEALVTPLVADPAHPFPHIRNLRPALAVMVRTPEGDEHMVAIELPGDLPRFVPLPGGYRFVMLDDVIEASLPELYPGLEVVRAHTFRVTRSAQIDLDGEPFDVLQAVEEEVTRRPFQEVVRLEVEHAMPPGMRHHLLREFQYELEDQLSVPGEQDVYTVGRLVDFASLAEIADIDNPELKYPPLPQRDPIDADRSVFEVVRERDLLFRFPHDSFEHSVLRFLHEAAVDPAVVSIKITLYRTGSESPVIDALREARSNGKEVAALLELKASFDEQRNIEWARDLEQDGIRVVFSPAAIKVHAKIALIVRREDDGLARYAYIGTGNLNATTARSYIDLGLLTADPELGREVGAVFNLLTGYSGGAEIRRLIVAPFDMRRRLLRLIERETAHARAGRDASIRAQMNGLADRRLIGALYRASQAGVRIRMTVREICSLRPGVPGVSDNIAVVSVVGRLLQHARIFHFHNGGDDEYYIGSADWRPRNLSDRIEVITPVSDPAHHALLDAALDETFHDPAAWQLGAAGEYTRRGTIIGGAATPEPAADAVPIRR